MNHTNRYIIHPPAYKGAKVTGQYEDIVVLDRKCPNPDDGFVALMAKDIQTVAAPPVVNVWQQPG